MNSDTLVNPRELLNSSDFLVASKWLKAEDNFRQYLQNRKFPGSRIEILPYAMQGGDYNSNEKTLNSFVDFYVISKVSDEELFRFLCPGFEWNISWSLMSSRSESIKKLDDFLRSNQGIAKSDRLKRYVDLIVKGDIEKSARSAKDNGSVDYVIWP